VDSVLLKNYQYLPVIKSTACNMDMQELNSLGNNLIINSPNPFANSTKLLLKQLAAIRWCKYLIPQVKNCNTG